MADNSPIQAKGIGKNAKRHDLSGTPGLNSDLQYGEVQQLEQGQKLLGQRQQAAPVAGAAPAPAGQAPPMQVPDPVSFAVQKIGGGRPNVPSGPIQQIDTSKFLPLLRQMTASGSSPLLMNAYVRMLNNAQNRQVSSGGTALIDVQAYDAAVETGFGNNRL